MRIVVFGQQAFGKDVFDSLVAAGEEVVGISTPKPREGRTDPLAEAAREKKYTQRLHATTTKRRRLCRVLELETRSFSIRVCY